MTDTRYEAYGLRTPDGELLSGNDIRPRWNQTTMVPISNGDLQEHVYMLYVTSDDENELRAIAVCAKAFIGLELRLAQDKRGRPYLWRAVSKKKETGRTTTAHEPEFDIEDDYRSVIYEVPEGYNSWDAFGSVNC